MQDKEIMENELSLIKGMCDLYLHGTLESTTKDVHDKFKCALEETLNIQNKLYNLMKDKGWYEACNVPQEQITTVKEKCSSSN